MRDIMWPKHYFYTVATSENTYSSTPSNVLSVSRLLLNKPYWQKSGDSALLKKKTLIFNISEGDADTNNRIIRKLMNLIWDDFNIGYYDENRDIIKIISRFEHQNLTDALSPIIKSLSTLPDKTLIQKTLKQLNLMHDQILIMNKDETQQFLAWCDDWRNLPSFKKAHLIKSHINAASLNQFFSAKGNEIEELYLNDCTNLQNTVFDQLKLTKLKRLTLLCDIDTQQINNIPLDAINTLITAAHDTLERIELRRHPQMDSSVIQTVMNVNSLTSLYLGDWPNLGEQLPEHLNLAKLQTLDLEKCTINCNSLGRIIRNAPDLKALSLYHCDIVDIDNLYNVVADLKNLFSLGLYGLSISNHVIDKIKASHPNIEISNRVAVKPNEQSLDANTTPNPDTVFHVKRIFYPGMGAPTPEIPYYRLQSFNSFTINKNYCTINQAFLLNNASSDLQLEKRTIPSSKTDLFPQLNNLPNLPHEYYGKHTLHLTYEWQALPSLSFNEVMTKYHLSQDISVDIHYSKRDNFYYIRTKPGSVLPRNPIDIDFIIAIPPIPNKQPIYSLWLFLVRHLTRAVEISLYLIKVVIMLALYTLGFDYKIRPLLAMNDTLESALLPNDIKDKIKDCLAFQSKSLEMPQTNPTGYDYLNALNQQQTGACRHRSFLFKTWMQEHYPDIPVRIINNGCHSFIEIKYNDQWQSYDLGGYSARLVISELHKPSVQASSPPIVELTSKDKTEKPPERRYFVTLPNEQKKPETIGYIHQLLSSNHPNTLIEADNSDQIAGLRYHLQKQCKHISRPYFYVHSPEDLIYQAPWIELTDNTIGTIRKGPGGKLHDFLMAHATDETKPLLIINYDQFSASDIVRFNALIDTTRQADGTSLPDNTQVIGLINPTKQNAYDGRDFYSRFDHTEACVLSDDQLQIPPVINSSAGCNESTQRIELYGGNTWEERLLGYWSLDGQSLQFNEGELVRALNAGKTRIDLSNAPWETSTFECFWQTAMLNGSIEINNKQIPLPPNFTLTKSEGYAFDHAKTIIDETQPAMPSHVLNPGVLSHFLGQYRCEAGAVHPEKGIIAAHANQRLSVYVSHSLTDADWSRILDACKQHNVRLNLRLAHDIILPAGFNIEFKPEPAPTINAWTGSGDNIKQITYIESTDISATLASINKNNTITIDISEVDPADLLIKINAQFDKTSLQFHFDEQTGALLKALQENKSIILKGHFSADMKYVLSELLYKRQNDPTLNSQLLLIGNEPNPFPFITSYTHVVTVNEKKRTLLNAFPDNSLPDYFIEEKKLSELIAICLYQTQDVTLPWKGMEKSPITAPATQPSIDLVHAEEKTHAFNQERLNAVEQTLKHSPFVFLAGMSGVGKTSFVKNSWKAGALYIGKDNMTAWATDTTPGIKTLFIDEANISSENWTAFEGLIDNHPPLILIGNQIIELSIEHKVIFAGNPLSYGGERQMPTLFKDHGNSVFFTPMPPEFIYQTMLKSIITEEMAQPILAIHTYLTSCSDNEILITPRELTSMALFTQCYCMNNPDSNPVAVAQFYAYTLSKHLVPEAFKNEFENKFNVIKPLKRTLPNLEHADFISTKSNQPAQEALDDFLNLRAHRQSSNASIQKGGLGGLILEGEPGIGKTELVAKTLTAYGLKKANNLATSANSNSKNVFYIIPVSTPLPQKIKLLMKAFHEGAVVVMDEINSAPMMERLLNDLLMGQTPDGQPPLNPGFLLIGTQNPITMAGRSKASAALQHRMQTVIMPDYRDSEMIAILKHKGLSKKTAKNMVTEYINIRQEADKNPEESKFCFRDLLKRADIEIRALAHENGASKKLASSDFKALVNGRYALHKTNNYRKSIQAQEEENDLLFSQNVKLDSPNV